MRLTLDRALDIPRFVLELDKDGDPLFLRDQMMNTNLSCGSPNHVDMENSTVGSINKLLDEYNVLVLKEGNRVDIDIEEIRYNLMILMCYED